MRACKQSIAQGGPVSNIVDAIRGTRWRFILTRSGQDIEVEHKDDLYDDYWEAVALLKDCRSIVGKEEYEDVLAGRIRDCHAAYRRAETFITSHDNIGGNVERAIEELFSGTGYKYNGVRAEYDDSDE